MFGKNPRISPLELRKQLLVAESELNRAQLVQELQTTVDGFRSLADHAKSFGLIISSTAILLGAFTAFRRRSSGRTGARPFPFQSILKGASLIKRLWTVFRPRNPDADQTNPQNPSVG
jgi:hypothetical protein